MAGTCECSTTSTELDNKCPDQLSLLVIKTAVWKIAKTPLTESFDLEVWPPVWVADSCTEENIWMKFNEIIIQRGYNEPTPNWRVNPKTLKYDLDLESICQVMSSANHLDEGNIWVKSNENTSKGSGDMEQKQNSRVNPMT